MRFACALAAAAILVAGCTTPVADNSTTTTAPPPAAPATFAAQTFAANLKIGAPENYGIAGEPSLAISPNGTYYVSAPLIDAVPLAKGFVGLGQFGQGRVWRSTDGSAFSLLNDANGWLDPKGEAGDGDTDIAVDASGRVHFVDLGAGIPYLNSDDTGNTWTDRGSLSDPSTSVDRQWITVRGESLIVSWRDFGGNKATLRVNVSPDGGESWSGSIKVADDAIAGPVVLAPNRQDAYLPYQDTTLHVAVSHNAGINWTVVDTNHVIPSPGNTDLFGGAQTLLFPVIDVDAAGNAYLAWSEHRADGTGVLQLMRSSDAGATWQSLGEVSAPGGNDIFPWIVAGDAGRISIVHLTSDLAQDPGFGPHQWHLAVATSLDADQGKATFNHGLVVPEVVHLGAICTSGTGCGTIVFPLYGDRTILDFFEAAIGPDGSLAVAWTETHEESGRNPQIHFTHQTGGSRLRA